MNQYTSKTCRPFNCFTLNMCAFCYRAPLNKGEWQVKNAFAEGDGVRIGNGLPWPNARFAPENRYSGGSLLQEDADWPVTPPVAHWVWLLTDRSCSRTPLRAVLNEKKSVLLHNFPKKVRGHTMCWRWAVGSWRLATGSWWRLVVVGGGWWLEIGG